MPLSECFTRPRLWPWYRVTFTTDNGGDFADTTAQSEADAKSIIFWRHGAPGMRITGVEFARWHPANRALLGLLKGKEQR